MIKRDKWNDDKQRIAVFILECLNCETKITSPKFRVISTDRYPKTKQKCVVCGKTAFCYMKKWRKK